MHAFVENSLKLLLSPLLLYQGLRVRKHALILPEPAGPRSGITVNSGPPLHLLIIGDSSAAGVGVATQSEALSGQLAGQLGAHFSLNWDLVAQTGATTASTLQTARALPAKPYDAVVVALGVNDVTHSIPLRRWLNQQAELIALLKDKFGAKYIYTSGLPPMKHFPVLPQPLRYLIGSTSDRFSKAITTARQKTPAIRDISLNLPLDPALMAEDGFHPGAEVYSHWAETLATFIRQDFLPRKD